MAHKKGQGSSRNGRDSNSQRLGVKRFGGEQVTGRHDHPPPARHQVEARQERGPGQGPHALRAGGRRGPLRGPRRARPARERPARRELAAAASDRPHGRPAMFVDRVKIFVKGGRRRPRLRELPPRALRSAGRSRRRAWGAGAATSSSRPSPTRTRCCPCATTPSSAPSAASTAAPATARAHRGSDLVVAVPPGTIARDEETGETLGEVLREGERLVVARGGRGGRGNRSFLSNRNRAPARGRAGRAGRGALAAAWTCGSSRTSACWASPTRASRRCSPRISAARPKVARLPLHHADAGAGRGGGATTAASWPPTSRASSRARTRARAWACSSCATSSARACSLHVVDASGTSGRDPVADLARRARGGPAVGRRRCWSGPSSWPPPSATRGSEPDPLPALRASRAPARACRCCRSPR